jgi:hypothetical protein
MCTSNSGGPSRKPRDKAWHRQYALRFGFWCAMEGRSQGRAEARPCTDLHRARSGREEGDPWFALVLGLAQVSGGPT